jgi:hypothetical protein
MKYGGDAPQTSFPIPPEAPKAVEVARENFGRVVGEWAEAQANLAALQETGHVRIAGAKHAAAQARIEGGKLPTNPAKVEAEVQAGIAAAREDVNALETAVHETGNALCYAIDEHKDGAWLDSLEAAEDAALGRFTKGMAMVRQALSDLGSARRGPAFLREFDLGNALGGMSGGFAGEQILINATHSGVHLDSHTDPVALLDLVEREVVDPWQQPEARPLPEGFEIIVQSEPVRAEQLHV